VLCAGTRQFFAQNLVSITLSSSAEEASNDAPEAGGVAPGNSPRDAAVGHGAEMKRLLAARQKAEEESNADEAEVERLSKLIEALGSPYDQLLAVVENAGISGSVYDLWGLLCKESCFAREPMVVISANAPPRRSLFGFFWVSFVYPIRSVFLLICVLAVMSSVCVVVGGRAGGWGRTGCPNSPSTRRTTAGMCLPDQSEALRIAFAHAWTSCWST